jgi:GNAT superfamily N-acetyltransferase
MYARLSDDRIVFVRPIYPGDKDQLAEGLKNLSLESVHKRFLGPKPTFTEAELRYLTEVDGHDHFALVALPAGEPDDIVAVARFIRLADDPLAAEAAITVCDEYQGVGLGSLLARRLADAAREHGVERLTATMASDNRAALRLMRQIDERLSTQRLGSSVTEIVAELADEPAEDAEKHAQSPAEQATAAASAAA